MSPFHWRWWRVAFSGWNTSPGGTIVYPGYETWKHVGRGLWWMTARASPADGRKEGTTHGE